MIVAKTAETFTDLQKQFKERKVVKKYIALVHGRLEPKEGNIRLPLARKPKDRKKFDIRLGGKEGITEYKRLAVYNILIYYKQQALLKKSIGPIVNDRLVSLVELMPKTGRTHQLRVHLKHIGHPIVSDSIYLGKKRLKEDLKWCPRLFLHAKYLSFTDPKLNKKVEFESDLPKELSMIIDSFLWSREQPPRYN